VDISWSNAIGIHKTALLAAYSNVDPRVRPFVLFVKHWSKRRNVSDTRRGGMGSFAWCLLCIYFLMKAAKPPVVPNLQAMATERKYFQGFDVSFSKDAVVSNHWSKNKKVRVLYTYLRIN
jgi:terminal uridylyltransferase